MPSACAILTPIPSCTTSTNDRPWATTRPCTCAGHVGPGCTRGRGPPPLRRRTRCTGRPGPPSSTPWPSSIPPAGDACVDARHPSSRRRQSCLGTPEQGPRRPCAQRASGVGRAGRRAPRSVGRPAIDRTAGLSFNGWPQPCWGLQVTFPRQRRQHRCAIARVGEQSKVAHVGHCEPTGVRRGRVEHDP